MNLTVCSRSSSEPRCFPALKRGPLGPVLCPCFLVIKTELAGPNRGAGVEMGVGVGGVGGGGRGEGIGSEQNTNTNVWLGALATLTWRDDCLSLVSQATVTSLRGYEFSPLTSSSLSRAKNTSFAPSIKGTVVCDIFPGHLGLRWVERLLRRLILSILTSLTVLFASTFNMPWLLPAQPAWAEVESKLK